MEMEKKWLSISIKILIMILYLLYFSGEVIGDNKTFSAMYVFGDSLIDNGNNNFQLKAAKANFLPYGIDFIYASGRFTNGKTVVDYFAERFGLPHAPPFASIFSMTPAILTGVNYASAAGGILDNTGEALGSRFSLRRQIENFRITKKEMGMLLVKEELDKHIGKALAVMIIGSNDYINNYLNPDYPTRFLFNPTQFATYLVDQYSNYITELYKEGLRRFFIAGIGALGCVPGQRTIAKSPPFKCAENVNDVIHPFNQRLENLVNHRLNLSDAVFFYANTYSAQMEILNNPLKYGLTEISEACCGLGKNRAEKMCLPLLIPCMDRDVYAWWDAYHPSQTVHKTIATMAFNGTYPFIHPFNFEQMIPHLS